jgi:hypothetical protein
VVFYLFILVLFSDAFSSSRQCGVEFVDRYVMSVGKEYEKGVMSYCRDICLRGDEERSR